ncbi:unnamed protein product [Durusdinium trenchii]|uniref:5'-nucleotidase n=1 Tax=Durusdinium trenchii TaxID=1381693 RepID=A0ABP0QKN0_9DINO
MDERGSLLEPHHLADRADPSPRSAPLRRGLAACATAAALVAAVVLVLHARVLRAAERGSLRHDAERSSDGTGETLASLCYAASEQRLKLGLTEIPPGACHIHSGFCRGPDDRLEYHDCDGDDILDPYCVAFDKLSFGYISSKGNCRNNWPNGLCLNQDEPSIANAEKVVPALANEITIIHFNDVYEMAGVLKDGTRKGGMSRAAYVIERARKRNPDRTLVVFAGDLLSPSVLSDLFQGRQAVDVLNYLNLTAASLGNHEFDFGVDVLRQRMQESKFPWLNLNLMDEHGRLLAGTQKHKIIDLPYAPRWSKEPNTKTTRLCLFGVAYDLLQTLYKDKERLRYKDAQEAAVQEARELRKTHQCSVVLALTHQFAKDDCALAKAAGKDLDLILGGHDHFTDLRSDCGHATYLKADSDLKTQWVMTMMLDDEGFSESIEGKLLSLTDQDPFSPSVHDKVVQWEERGQAELGKRIGCSTVPLDTRESQVRQQETGVGNFIADAVQAMHKTDVVLIAGGTIRGNKVFPAGNLSKKVLTELHPFGNSIVKLWVTGRELRTYIDDMLGCYSKVCGRFVNVAGVSFHFDPSMPSGHRVTHLAWRNGTALLPDGTLTVAMTDYAFSTSGWQKHRLFDMVTTNDAIPLVLAIYSAVEVAAQHGHCVAPKVEGRMVKKSTNS